jgi:HlyD family secretion protein
MIFRKVALERLSSPEQLDQLLQVTSPKSWLALAGLGALLAAGLGWGIWGSIPTEAAGNGIILRQGGVPSVLATGSGQVEELLVGAGDPVVKGQPVAVVRQEALLRQLRDAETKARAAARDYGDLARYASSQRQLRGQDLTRQRANLEQSVKTLDKDISLLADRSASEEKLLADGLITRQAWLTTQQSLNAKKDELAQKRLELEGLPLKRLEGDQQLDQQLQARQAAQRDAELERREAKAKLDESSRVLSPHDGRVVEILADRGTVVSPGTPIVSLETTAQELTAILFVPAAAGKKIQPGMRARVYPSTVKREEHGGILGKVTWVAEFPSTARGMTQLLGNEGLVAKLAEAGALIQVNVALERDPKTMTGFRWTSTGGPNLKIGSGTLASGGVIVEEERPIRLLIPRVRESLGL